MSIFNLTMLKLFGILQFSKRNDSANPNRNQYTIENKVTIKNLFFP